MQTRSALKGKHFSMTGAQKKPLHQLHIAQSEEEGLKLLQEATVLKSYSPIAWVLTKRCLNSIYYGWKAFWKEINRKSVHLF